MGDGGTGAAATLSLRLSTMQLYCSLMGTAFCFLVLFFRLLPLPCKKLNWTGEQQKLCQRDWMCWLSQSVSYWIWCFLCHPHFVTQVWACLLSRSPLLLQKMDFCDLSNSWASGSCHQYAGDSWIFWWRWDVCNRSCSHIVKCIQAHLNKKLDVPKITLLLQNSRSFGHVNILNDS